MIAPDRSAAGPNRRRKLFAALLLASLSMLALPTGAFAEVQVTGRLDALRIEAKESTLGEVLAALGQTLHFHYRAGSLLGQPVTGVYHGPLQRVLGSLLQGHDFSVKTSSSEIELVVLGQDNGPTTTAGIPMNAATAAAQPVTRANTATPAAQPVTPANTTTAAAAAQPVTPVPRVAPPQPSPPSGEAQLEKLRQSLPRLLWEQ